MKNLFRKEVVIGLIVIISIAILVVGIDFLKGVNVFKASNYYYATYSNVEGLSQSAPVMLNGYKVGQVRDITYLYENPGHVLVEISVNKDLHLPRGTKAVIVTDLLGTANIQLDMASGTDFHTIGDTLIATNAVGLMQNVQEQIMPAVSAIFPKIDTLLTSVNTLVSDPAILASVKRLDAITANLEASTRRLNALMATLPPITKNVTDISENLNLASADMAAFTSRVKELPVDSLVANINDVTANLRQLTEDLGNKNSTLGKLMNDPALYNSLNSSVSSLDSLLVDIKKNPKRYISIKLL